MTNLQSDLDFSVSDICSKEMSKIIVTLFAATGCDVTSSFFVLTKELFGNELKKQKLGCLWHNYCMKTSINLY